MGNGVVKFDAARFQLARQNAAAAAQPTNAVSFLKMSKFGDWVFGRENESVNGNTVMIDPEGFVQGWQCWADTDIKGVQTELQGEVLGSLFGDLIPCPTEQHKNTQGWKALLGLSGVMDGRKLTYTATSDGGKKAVFKLLDEILAQGARDPDKPVAVVRLESDSYMHKNTKRGEIFVPMFSVVKWMTVAQATQAIKAAASAPPPQPEKAAPKKQAKQAARPTPRRAA